MVCAGLCVICCHIRSFKSVMRQFHSFTSRWQIYCRESMVWAHRFQEIVLSLHNLVIWDQHRDGRTYLIDRTVEIPRMRGSPISAPCGVSIPANLYNVADLVLGYCVCSYYRGSISPFGALCGCAM